MRWIPKSLPCLVICITSIPVIPQQAKAKEEGEPQMVWVNYVEGEVKFSPGHNGKPALGNDWIEVAAGQVMEDGYTLATEKGRAEIEFENGTVVYLAGDSVLEFNRLWVTAGAIDTRLNLLTGTATISHLAGQDAVRVETPTATMRLVGTETMKVDSTLDGVVVHAVDGVVVPLIGGTAVKTLLKPGESAAFVEGRLIPLKEPGQTRESEEWDQWVAGRLAERRALVAEGLKETGLSEPIPGLAGMVKNGEFSDCAPYGKCWEPNERAEQEGTGAAPEATENDETSAGRRRRNIVVNYAMLFRCPMETWLIYARDPLAPDDEIEYGTCFAGSWAHRKWVAGRRHHHPCHFVKVGRHGIGIVPRHPQDQKGKPPINAKSGILVLVAEKGRLQAEVRPTPSKGIQVVAGPRSGIERGLMANAPRVAQPVIEARLAESIVPRGVLGAEHIEAQKNVTAIRFDFKTKDFVGRSNGAGNPRGEVVAHVGSGGRGGSQVQMGGHGGTGGGGGGSHGSSGGGGGSSGGGGGHSGGGSSAGSSAGAGSGGGGHH